MIGGWAVDLDAAEGTGVTTLHAWAYPAAGGAPIFLGATAYGGARPDVAAVHGDQFKDSGFGLIAQGLPAGDYDLARRRRAAAHDGQHNVAARLRRRRPVLRDHDRAGPSTRRSAGTTSGRGPGSNPGDAAAAAAVADGTWARSPSRAHSVTTPIHHPHPRAA